MTEPVSVDLEPYDAGAFVAPTNFAEAEEVLAARLPGYTHRPQQKTLAEAVERTFAEGGQLLGQAGCGVGKSLAGLIPAIMWAVTNNKRVVVATATKALQDQYAEHDLPFLEQNLGVNFRWTLLKGRSNYLCHEKLEEATPQDVPYVNEIRDLLDDRTITGDIEWMPVHEEHRRFLTMSSQECPGKKDCKYGQSCFFELAKAKAQEAHIVVTNVSMLMMDLVLRRQTDSGVQLLGEYDAVLIDEAHELPEYATKALSTEVRENGIIRLCDEVQTFGQQVGADFTKQTDAIRLATTELWMGLDEAKDGDNPVQIQPEWIAERGDIFVNMIEALASLETAMAAFRITGDEKASLKKARLRKRLGNYVLSLHEFATSDSLVRWIEIETRKGKKGTQKNLLMKASPLDIAPFMRSVWEQTPAVLVSATLAVGSDFGYIRDTLGLPQPRLVDVGTPFDYQAQSLLFVPEKGAPEPSGRTREQWQSYAIAMTGELVSASGGGALLLYTSRTAMQNAYQMLAPSLNRQGIATMMQGDAPNKDLAQRFKADENSVLFALKSFFTGVDFPGDTLRLVVIDKLPFAVPTDILVAARTKALDERYGPWQGFNRLAVPTMALTLIQGFGRLIRTHADHGTVAILDSRLNTKGYGKKILGALPPAPQTGSLDEVKRFYSAR